MPFKDRKSPRFELRRPVDVTLHHKRMAFGMLVDISRDGLGFQSQQRLTLGETYLISIRDVGSVSCKILNAGGYNRYGGRFMISDYEKRKLQTKIELVLSQSSGSSAALRSLSPY